MKKLSQDLEDMLLDYIDGNLTAEQREVFEQSLRVNHDLQLRLEEMRLLTASLKQQNFAEPASNFTTEVMNRIDRYPARTGLSFLNGVLLLCGILVVLAITVTLLSKGVFNETTSLDLNNLGIANQYIKQSLPSVPIDGKLIVNIIVILNLALAFVVLDKAILKPLFNKRMDTGV